MYPARYLGLFPAFPLHDVAFVVMSFADEFRNRRENVIVPAIEAAGLKPLFADTRDVSDSIITEIVEGIRSSRVIIGDISVDKGGIRNANVMYEIGIAHAARQPEEVLLFRSDDHKLLFDLANIRVNRYDPDNDTDASLELIRKSIVSAIDEVDLTMSAAVSTAARQLDEASLIYLVLVALKGPQPDPNHKKTHPMARANTHAAIRSLLRLGCIETVYPKVTSEHRAAMEAADGVHNVDEALAGLSSLEVSYEITVFGMAVFRKSAENMFGDLGQYALTPV